ncbi:RidA family protein [Streptomyces sp. NPDC048258]|uniref:RidA family protein n=1 Tax=Streptomyces sp. NPDC048258 TaxID=3365527 RepID=UPI003722767E
MPGRGTGASAVAAGGCGCHPCEFYFVVSEDFADQVAQAFANLRTALAAVGLGPADVVRIGTYIVGHDQEKLEVLLKELHATWGTELPAQTLIGVAALALPGMLFEIDAVAVRPS